MLLPVLDWSLSSDNSLDVEPEHGEHGKPSVLDLLDLELGKGVRVVGKTERVEVATRVEGVQTLAGWATVGSVGLGETHEHNLKSQDGNDALGVNQGWVSEVVEPAVLEDEGALLEPWVRGQGGVPGQLRSDAPEGTEHTPPGVDELSLPVGSEGLRVGRESSAVPTVVARELPVEVGWYGVVGVWSKPLWSVRTVPGACGALLDRPAGLGHDTRCCGSGSCRRGGLGGAHKSGAVDACGEVHGRRHDEGVA